VEGEQPRGALLVVPLPEDDTPEPKELAEAVTVNEAPAKLPPVACSEATKEVESVTIAACKVLSAVLAAAAVWTASL